MEQKSILLINPPVSKPCEPVAGLAKLAGFLRSQGVDCRVYDASLDGLLGILDRPIGATDTWTRRSLAHRKANRDALRSPALYNNRDRYKRAVVDLNHIVHMAALPYNATVSLANYNSAALSPVRSADLIQAAEQFEANPFYLLFSEALTTAFDDREPDIIGLSINFMSQALCAFAIVGFIKNRLPDAAIVCGGGLVTSWMKIPDLGNPFGGWVDELVDGPGEDRLLGLCTGKTVQVPPITGYDFSWTDPERYLAPVRILPYSTSRGCYWKKCAFCPETAEDAPYLTTRPQAILDDLQRIAGQTGAGLIHFLDNALSPRMLAHLIDDPPGLPWYGFARVTRHLTDPAFVTGLKDAGCVMLKLGVESGDQRVLDALSKGVQVATVSQALTTIHRAGIATYVYLLFGTPAEDEASAHRTLEFTLAHAACIDFLNLAIFNLPAHGDEAGSLDTLEFYAGDLSLYRQFIHPKGWNRDRVRRFLSKSFKKPAAVKKILNDDPPFFTSNHAPFFSWSGNGSILK